MTVSRFRLIFLAVPLVFLTTYSCTENTEDDLLKKQIKPIIWGTDDLYSKQRLSDFQQGKREIHPLDIGKSLVYTAYKYQLTGDSSYKNLSMGFLALVEKLYAKSEYFDQNTFKYNFAHGKLKPGWWSGMANSAIILGLTFCDKVYDTDHQEIIDALVLNLKSDYKEGGSLYTFDENKTWILEYAWPEIKEESVKYVLNGFLYSLVCLKMANNISSNPDLELLFNKGWKGLEYKIEDYYFKGVKWTKYDLNPTIEPPHYAIFDIILLESLTSFKEEKEEWLERALTNRRSIIKKAYPLDIMEIDDSSYRLMFSLIGPPNPYWIDTYPIEINIKFIDGETKSLKSNPPKDFEMNIFKRGFIDFNLDKSQFTRIEEITVTSEYLGQRQQLYKYTQKELLNNIPLSDENLRIKIYPLSANYDGVFMDSLVKIDPKRIHNSDIINYKNNVAQIVIPFKETEQFNDGENLVLKVNNTIEILDHKFFLHTEDGNVLQKYSESIPVGENVIVLNPTQFNDYDNNKGIKKIVWQVYTSRLNSEGIVKIDEVFRVKSSNELERIRSSKVEEPQIIKCNPLTAKFDAEFRDSVVVVDSDKFFDDNIVTYKNGIAQVVIPLNVTRYFQENENIVLKVESDLEISNHKFFFYDTIDSVSQRYYLPIPKGKNIMVLNPVGFSDFKIENGIKRIVWQIYTNEIGKGKIKINDILKTENNFQLRKVFSDSTYNFEEKIIRGNIY